MADTPTYFYTTIYRGSRRILQFTVTDDAGAAVDVAGWTVVFRLRQQLFDADPALSVNADLGSPTSDGELSVTLTRTNTLALAAGVYHASLFRTNADDERPIAVGKVEIRESGHDAPA